VSSIPYSISWRTMLTGNYLVDAIAEDDSGNAATSTPITVKITKQKVGNLLTTSSTTTPDKNAGGLDPGSRSGPLTRQKYIDQ
jgi:hypothetical protein